MIAVHVSGCGVGENMYSVLELLLTFSPGLYYVSLPDPVCLSTVYILNCNVSGMHQLWPRFDAKHSVAEVHGLGRSWAA